MDTFASKHFKQVSSKFIKAWQGKPSKKYLTSQCNSAISEAMLLTTTEELSSSWATISSRLLR